MLNESLNISDYAQRHIEGKITIELLDARTGKVCKKVDASNFVAVPAINHLQWKQREAIKSGISTLNSSLDDDVKPQPVFNGLYLSDDSDEGTPVSDITIPGNLIGFADKNAYSGSNTLRGSINVGLSEATSAYTKWVFDWPTHAANGTINTVGWTNMKVSPATPYALTSGTYTRLSSNVRGRYVARANSNMIFIAQGSSIATVGIYDSDMNAAGSITAQTFMSGIAWDHVNEWLWVLRTPNITAYNTDGQIQKTLTIPSLNYQGLAFDGTNLWTTTGSGTSTTMVAFSADDGSETSTFGIVLDQNTYGSLIEMPIGLCWDNVRNCLWLMTNNNVNGGSWENYTDLCRLIPISTSGTMNKIAYTTYAWGASTGNYEGMWYYSSSYLGDVDFVDANTLIMTNNIDSTQSIHTSLYSLNSLGSRAKLPSTIAKTSGQTMRVTYQMNYS